MRYAVINSTNNIVQNVIELDGGVEWFAPEGFFAVPSETLNIMDIYTGEE